MPEPTRHELHNHLRRQHLDPTQADYRAYLAALTNTEMQIEHIRRHLIDKPDHWHEGL